MLKTLAIALVAVTALSGTATALADNDPTAGQIYQAARSGRLGEAQQMIDQVLRDHPNSAKAHFIAAELDARVGDFATAEHQLATAKRLDPSNGFTSAQALSELQAQLTGVRATPAPYVQQGFAPQRHSSIPWGLILVVGLGALVIWSLFRARAASTYATYPNTLPPAAPGQPGYGYGPGYPPPMGGGGSGLMGSLASGLAIGAGVAAGEELVHHVLDGNRPEGYIAPASDLRDSPPVNSDMGGNDFGVSDPGSWDDSSSGGGFFDGGGDSGGGDWT